MENQTQTMFKGFLTGAGLTAMLVGSVSMVQSHLRGQLNSQVFQSVIAESKVCGNTTSVTAKDINGDFNIDIIEYVFQCVDANGAPVIVPDAALPPTAPSGSNPFMGIPQGSTDQSQGDSWGNDWSDTLGLPPVDGNHPDGSAGDSAPGAGKTTDESDEGGWWLDSFFHDITNLFSGENDKSGDGTTKADPNNYTGPEICGDGQDNDGDDYTDSEDDECGSVDVFNNGQVTEEVWPSDAMQWDESTFLMNDSMLGMPEFGNGDQVHAGPGDNGMPEVMNGGCSDGIDNDGDGWTDGADPDCTRVRNEGPGSCNNGFDDDFNGMTDQADPVCSNFEENMDATGS